jgi:multiple sugar transport system permease protein
LAVTIPLAAGAFVMALPFLWMISTSLKTPDQIFAYPMKWMPSPFVFENYVRAFEAVPMLRYIFNSLFTALSVTLSNLFFCSLAGYSLAKFEYPGRNAIFITIISTLMIPAEATIVPTFIIVRKLGWVDSYAALIFPAAMNAFGVFMMRQSMTSIPQDLIDCARIDGCGEFGIYLRIILPLSKAPLSALSIFMFMWSWNAFLWPLVVIRSQSLFTLPVGLTFFQDDYLDEYNLIMAGSVIAVIPILILFISLQKHFIKGMTLSGMKM